MPSRRHHVVNCCIVVCCCWCHYCCHPPLLLLTIAAPSCSLLLYWQWSCCYYCCHRHHCRHHRRYNLILLGRALLPFPTTWQIATFPSACYGVSFASDDGRNCSILRWKEKYEVAWGHYFNGIGVKSKKNLFVTTADLHRNRVHFNGSAITWWWQLQTMGGGQDGLKSITNHTFSERFFNEESSGVLRFVRFLMVQKLWALKH